MKQRRLIILSSIGILGALLYIQTLPFGFSGDDGIYSINNLATKQGLSNWKDLFRYGSMNFLEVNPSNTSIYRPFTLLTFAIEYEILGRFSPKVGHALNVGLYAGVLLVIGFLLTQITEKSKHPFLLVIFT